MTRIAAAPARWHTTGGNPAVSRPVTMIRVPCQGWGRQPAIRLSLRICLSKARAGTMRRSVLTRPAVGPAV